MNEKSIYQVIQMQVGPFLVMISQHPKTPNLFSQKQFGKENLCRRSATGHCILWDKLICYIHPSMSSWAFSYTAPPSQGGDKTTLHPPGQAGAAFGSTSKLGFIAFGLIMLTVVQFKRAQCYRHWDFQLFIYLPWMEWMFLPCSYFCRPFRLVIFALVSLALLNCEQDHDLDHFVINHEGIPSAT